MIYKLNEEFKVKINELLNSDAVNYLESSERLFFKNILDKNKISELESKNLTKIVEKYLKFVKN